MSEKKPLDKKPIHDLLTEKDAFLTTSEKIHEYCLRHTRGLIATLVVLVLAVLGTALYLHYEKKAEAAATLAYENSLAAGESAEGGDPAALEKVRADFAGRKAARMAAFRLVALYTDTGETDKALALAEELLATVPTAEAALKPVLLNALGGLYEAKGDFQKAAGSYESLLVMEHLGPNLKLDILMSLGRVYAAANRPEDAIRNYERLIREFPETLQAFMVNARLAELKGGPAAFPLPPDAFSSPAPSPAEAVVE